MASPPIVPCLWLEDQPERAAAFYVRTFPGGRVISTSRYPETVETPGGKPPGSILTVEVELAGQRFTLLNGGPLFRPNPSISFFVHVETSRDANRLYARLADGGEPLMEIGSYPWSVRYGWVRDRFGFSWQVMAGRRPPRSATIVPCLMFGGAQFGHAAKAIRSYTRIFPRGKIESEEKYGAGEGPEGLVKHGRFSLAGQSMVAMDGHIDPGFSFSEAISLQVMCRDQAELDRFWNALSKGGEKVQCGWLKDRFGVSWQVAPRRAEKWLASKDEQARDRFFAAMMPMKKLDIAKLERAFKGGPA